LRSRCQCCANTHSCPSACRYEEVRENKRPPSYLKAPIFRYP
jgi:hypothetical protein